MTLNCVGLTQTGVIRIIHCNVGLKCFFHLPKFLLLSLVFAYIYISQCSVETHYHVVENIIVTLLLIVPVKEFWKPVNNGRRCGHKYSATFFMAHSVHLFCVVMFPIQVWLKNIIINLCIDGATVVSELWYHGIIYNLQTSESCFSISVPSGKRKRRQTAN